MTPDPAQADTPGVRPTPGPGPDGVGGDSDLTEALVERVRTAAESGQALRLLGADTKSFLGRLPPDSGSVEPLVLRGHRGILDYQPKELVVTARGGTPLDEIDRVLAQGGQQLPFEPPRFGPGATLGGTLACGLSGPARPYAGAARDLVLGALVLTGQGDVLRFGGQVMKNVAGYDVSRLMAGAFGTLGVLLDLSLKVLPLPAATATRGREIDQVEAIETMARWAGCPFPVTATCWDGDRLWVRLSGAERGVQGAVAQIGGDPVDDAEARAFWETRIREQGHGFFAGPLPLWRLSVPPTTPPLELPGKQLLEWGGGLRWLKSDAPASSIRAAVARVGGHATLFRAGEAEWLRSGEVFHPLAEPLMRLHRRLKTAFDPRGILNPGRLYPGL